MNLENTGAPKYERFKDHLVNELSAGRLRPGDSLPSEHEWAETLNISRSTVRHALAELERAGLIRRVQGKGTFIHEQARQHLRRDVGLYALLAPETQIGYYPALLEGFEQAASELHKQVIVCNTRNDVDRQGNAILQLLDKDVTGVAIVPTDRQQTPAFHIRQLQQQNIPVVFCHRAIEGVQAPLIALPFLEIGRLAGRAFVEHAHRRVVFFSPYVSPSGLGYARGMRAELEAAGGEVEDVRFGDVNNPSMNPADYEIPVRRALEEVCARRNRPTGIFAGFDSYAEMIYLMLTHLGLRLPEDISLIGFGGARRDGAILRRLTSVIVDEADTGRRAVDLLDQMRRGEVPIDDGTIHSMPVHLGKGETLGPASAR
jgi:DNA-binding LacI/PurR family transcriptional regulator